NSIRICGSRTPAADPKFRCTSDLANPPGGAEPESCPCFNFDADGNLLDVSTGDPAQLTDLCPSADLPAGATGEVGPSPWTFQYFIFNQPACAGTQLNTPDNNFTCFNTNDLLSQAMPNATTEDLDVGANTNTIACTTKNASKTFNFLSCATICSGDSTVSAENGVECAVGETRFACGCSLTQAPSGAIGGCACGDAGTPPLEDGCAFDSRTCDIVCNASTPPPAPTPEEVANEIESLGTGFGTPITQCQLGTIALPPDPFQCQCGGSGLGEVDTTLAECVVDDNIPGPNCNILCYPNGTHAEVRAALGATSVGASTVTDCVGGTLGEITNRGGMTFSCTCSANSSATDLAPGTIVPAGPATCDIRSNAADANDPGTCQFECVIPNSD
ncbi:MAG: hypothetical protein FWD17_10380, partial [Polyangiaceae bacterium]|nr:hypothetical protein [Polyangiaceae bacterium]